MTFLATAPDGSVPTAEALEQAADVLARRFEAAGLDDPRVRIDHERIVVTVAGEVDRELMETLTARGELRFRKVIAQAPGAGEPEQDGPPLAVGEPYPEETWQGEVEEEIDSEAMQAALALVELDGEPDPGLLEAVGPFAELIGREVAVLPTKLQFYVPTVTCQQLAARPTGSVQEPAELVVACDEEGTTKYLLDETRVLGSDLRTAAASLPERSMRWTITLSFTADGQPRFTELTREATQNDSAVPFDPGQLHMNLDIDPDTAQWRFDPDDVEPHNRYEHPRTDGGPSPIRCDVDTVGYTGNCLVAIVLNNQVLYALQIESVIDGDVRITGYFTSGEARALAAVLQPEPLPVVLEIESVQP